MRKIIQLVILAVTTIWLSQPALAQSSTSEVVGTLTAYYAKTAFSMNLGGYGTHKYKKGDFIADSSHPCFSMKSLNKTQYSYQVYDGDMCAKSKVLKTNVTTKTYQMSRLPVSVVGEQAAFVSKEGRVAHIFVVKSNGHSIYNEGDEVITARIVGKYALSFYCPDENGYGSFFETVLNTNQGAIDFYNSESGQVAGIVEGGFQWNDFSTTLEGSVFEDNGKLRANVTYYSEAPIGTSDYLHSVAYIAAEDALYIDGTLYYRQK